MSATPTPPLCASAPLREPSAPVALSLRQPWAWAMIRPDVTDPIARAKLIKKDRIKYLENRRWWSARKGLVYVHAAKGWTRAQDEDLAMCRDTFPDLPWPDRGDYQLGGITGSFEVTGCVNHHMSRWFFGPYAFTTRFPRPLPFTPMRGSLSFFPVPPDILAQLQ